MRQQKAEEGVPTPWTGTSRAEQAPRTEASGDKRRPNAMDWIIRGGSSSTSRRTPDWIIRGQRAARRPGLEHPGWSRQQEPLHPRHESRGTRGGQTRLTGAFVAEQEGVATTTGPGERWLLPRAGMPGADQLEGVPTPRAGVSRGKWRPEAKETGGRDQGGAAKEIRPEATQRTRP